jgi:type IV pilus assembly protein PilX
MRTSCLTQRGASLVVALLMLVAVLLLGISAARIALQGEKASRNDRDWQIAFQAAEAGLMDAELDIENSPDSTKSRSILFGPDRGEGFVPDCAATKPVYQGLCSPANEGSPPVWQTIDFNDQSDGARSVPYGRFTGQSFQIGKGALPSRLPRYVIERLIYNRQGEDASMEQQTSFYRITSVGFGPRDDVQVMLQTYYRKEGN